MTHIVTFIDYSICTHIFIFALYVGELLTSTANSNRHFHYIVREVATNSVTKIKQIHTQIVGI